MLAKKLALLFALAAAAVPVYGCAAIDGVDGEDDDGEHEEEGVGDSDDGGERIDDSNSAEHDSRLAVAANPVRLTAAAVSSPRACP